MLRHNLRNRSQVTGLPEITRRWWRDAKRSPLIWILAFAALMRIPGLGWGLPASEGWDNDGIAPRDFLAGVVQTYSPGDYFTYPPLHLLLLTLLTWPGWVTALLKAHSTAQSDVIAEFIKVPYMTFFALVARLVSAVMSVATIALVGKIGEDIGGRRAGLCVAAVCALNPMLVYYGQVTNLDGPYLFWAVLASSSWIDAIARREPGRFRLAALFSVAAIATKDQAYALFLLSVPTAIILWFSADAWPRHNIRRVLIPLGVGSIIAGLLLLLVDGAITNPSGFAARIGFLLGPASQDYAFYTRDWHGRLRLLSDLWSAFPQFYPGVTAYLGVFGLALHVWRRRRERPVLIAGLFPLLAIVSFTLTFNEMALRSEGRFALPHSLFFAVYCGVAIDALAFAAQPFARWASRSAILALAAATLFQCCAVDAALLYDPRYDAEGWLAAHVRPGETIETYGLNVYLPRFPKQARVWRVEADERAHRSPLPNVIELTQPFEAVEARDPRFIVVSAFWVERFLATDDVNQKNGHIVSTSEQRDLAKTGAVRFFHDLDEGRLPYRLAHESAYASKIWPKLQLHGSLTESIRIFERVDVPLAHAP